MKDEAREKLMDDYALGELRREVEADRLRAAKAVAVRVEALAAVGDVDALAKLAPIVIAVVSGSKP